MCLHLSYLFLDFVISSYIRIKKKHKEKTYFFGEQDHIKRIFV